MCKKNRIFFLSFLTAVFALLSSGARAEGCMLNGHSVDPACAEGYTCEKQTGTLTCTQGGKPRGEWQIVNGKPVGPQKIYDVNGGWIEQNVDDKGMPDGLWKQYSAQGVLLGERDFAHGELNGQWRTFYPDGQPQEVAWMGGGAQSFRVHYTSKGKIMDLSCGKKHFMDEDIPLCGFGGKPVTINEVWGMNGTRDVTYLNGVVTNTVYNPN